MNVNNEKIKNFLLETVAIQNNRTFEKQLLYFRNGSGVCLLSFLWILYWATFNSESANTSTVIIFILTVFLVITISIFSIRKHKRLVNTWKIEGKPIDTPRRDKSFAGISAGIGTAIIILLVRDIDFSESLIIIFATLASILGILILTYSMCIYQHKLYLLRKYCPEIKDLKATDL